METEMTVREFIFQTNVISEKLGNWFMSLTIGQAILILFGILAFFLFYNGL